MAVGSAFGIGTVSAYSPIAVGAAHATSAVSAASATGSSVVGSAGGHGTAIAGSQQWGIGTAFAAASLIGSAPQNRAVGRAAGNSSGIAESLTLIGPPTLRYLSKITSEHNDKPKFMATVDMSVSPYTTLIQLLQQLPDDFDIDYAVGVQLDAVGLWVGRDRFATLQNVFFSLDDADLGLDQGWLQGPFDNQTHLSRLDDDHYRILLKAVIINNSWDSSIPVAYQAWDILFGNLGYVVLMQDEGGMHMAMALLRANAPLPIDAVTQAIFSSGEMQLRPSGVDLDFLIVEPNANTPLFGLDAENTVISGLDYGSFGQETFVGS